jgi:hypothetical protein
MTEQAGDRTQLFERKLSVVHLKHLALEEKEADLMRDAVSDPQGALVRAKFSRLKRGNA